MIRVTLGELITQGATQFRSGRIRFGQGTLHARDEARWLALAALKLPVDSADEIEAQPLTPRQIACVQKLFDRRVQERLPAAYITGTAWLKGYAFKVDQRVIIPRSFIAELILERFYPWIQKPSCVKRILDLCTGSGCLAIIAADCFPKATVVAADLSRDALKVAAINVRRHGLADRITLAQGDLFDALKAGHRDTHKSFDLILCNPPYVPHTKRKGLPKEFLHEPEMALMADDKGMALVQRVICEAGRFLTPKGLLVMEIGHERKACDAMMARDFPGVAPLWIETAEQSDNVFMLHASQLHAFSRRTHR